MSRYRVLQKIRRLDPIKDHQRIVFLSACFDFRFDMTRSLEFALFRTFCVPRISALLDRTGEFRNRPQKRYDDTDLIVSELLERGYTSRRGRRAIKRMNQLHSRFDIANDDMLYVLSTFIYEPIRWADQFGWRPMCEHERLAYFHFWRQVGRRMNIKQLPDDYDQFEQFNRDYENEHFTRTETNRRVGAATIELFVSWFPRLAAPLVRSAIYAMLDDRVREAFGFPETSRPMRWTVRQALRLRALGGRLLPARRRPAKRTEMTHRSYPNGYTIEQLGPSEHTHSNDAAPTT